MPKQPAFPGLRDAMQKKQTRRELFLSEMDAVVPWGRLLALIAPHYPTPGPKGGRPPMPDPKPQLIRFLGHPGPAVTAETKPMLITNMRRQHHVAPLAIEHRTILPGPEGHDPLPPSQGRHRLF